MGFPVVHFEIIGRSGVKLQEFYKKAFGWKIDSNNPIQYGIVKKEKRGIDGGIAAPEEGQPGHVTVYIEVPNTDTYLKKIERLGGKTILPTTTIPNMVTFALFADPDGNMIGLIKAPRKKKRS